MPRCYTTTTTKLQRRTVPARIDKNVGNTRDETALDHLRLKWNYHFPIRQSLVLQHFFTPATRTNDRSLIRESSRHMHVFANYNIRIFATSTGLVRAIKDNCGTTETKITCWFFFFRRNWLISLKWRQLNWVLWWSQLISNGINNTDLVGAVKKNCRTETTRISEIFSPRIDCLIGHKPKQLNEVLWWS